MNFVFDSNIDQTALIINNTPNGKQIKLPFINQGILNWLNKFSAQKIDDYIYLIQNATNGDLYYYYYYYAE